MWILSIVEIILSIMMLWVLIKISSNPISSSNSNATDDSSHTTHTTHTNQTSQIDPIEVISRSQHTQHNSTKQMTDDKDFIVLKFRATSEDDMEFDVFLFVDKKGNRTDADKSV